jgi:hypothetical protein
MEEKGGQEEEGAFTSSLRPSDQKHRIPEIQTETRPTHA